MFCRTSIISSSNKLTPALNSTSNTLFLDRYIEISANSDSGNSISNFLLRILQISTAES